MPIALSNEMLPLFSERAGVEGLVEGNYPGLHFYRISKPSSFKKVQYSGTRLIVVAQGSKRARLHERELAYDASRYLVMSGETEVCATVLEATPERPYLAMCLELPAELVAKNLLAFADNSSAALSSEPGAEPSPATCAAGEDGSLAFVSALDRPVTDAVTRFLRALGDPLDRRVVAPLAMEELVFRLLRTSAAKVVRNAVQAGDEAINEAMRYIRQNASVALSVEQVARHVRMSSSHFAHRFSAVARTTPMRFLKQVRLEAARDLMVQNKLRAGEAAQRVGYESTSHFNRDFKAAYGATPASYARQLREG
jgi:AraC-like DNA-binding protein